MQVITRRTLSQGQIKRKKKKIARAREMRVEQVTSIQFLVIGENRHTVNVSTNRGIRRYACTCGNNQCSHMLAIEIFRGKIK